MCFYGSLGYVQIASNFRIVTTLQEKLDDLLLPLPHLSKFLFHVVPPLDAHRSPPVPPTVIRGAMH
jgi:hypothetical protein